MTFDMTKPCATCPFRKQGGITGLRPIRVKEICEQESIFICHKTVDYEEYQDEDEIFQETEQNKYCAGFLIFQEKQGHANQMMRVSERIGLYDAEKYVNSPHKDEIFDNITDMIKAQQDT